MKASAILLTLMLTACCLAQEQTREVMGIVRDQQGTPLQGAIVEVENLSTLQVRSFITPVSGHYRFFGLYTDQDYRVRADYHNHWSKRRLLTRFDSANPKVLSLTVRRPIE
jgi:Carboxypeptidase regulatory-like domain